MPKDTAIKHPSGYYLVIRKNVITMLDGDVCAAAIFAYLEFETTVEIGRHERAAQPIEPWLQISMPSLHEHTVGLYSIRSLQERLDWLIGIGFLKESQVFSGSVKRYLFNVKDINTAISEKRHFRAPLFGVRKKTIGKTSDGNVGNFADESSAKNTDSTGAYNNREVIHDTGVQTPEVPFSFPQKNEIQNQPPASPEDSTLEPDPPRGGDPSQFQHLDPDVELYLQDPIDMYTSALYKRTRRGKLSNLAKKGQVQLVYSLQEKEREYGPEDFRLALNNFLATDSDWLRENKWPIKSFLKDVPRYLDKTHATPRKLPVAKPIGALPTQETIPNATALQSKLVPFPEYLLRWNAAVPEEMREKHWTQASPLAALFDAEGDPIFTDNFDLICERCVKYHKAGQLPGTFDWLFGKSVGQWNWYRTAKNITPWAEKPKSEQSKPKFKSDTEAYLDGIRARQAQKKEKVNGNGKDAGEHRPSDASDSGLVGVPVGNADDAKRPERLGKEPIGDC